MLAVFLILALVMAIAATVLAFIFFVPEKKARSRNPFVRFLHVTVTFKYLFVEKVMQALYILSTCYTVLQGFFLLFVVDNGDWYGGFGFLLMILGPVIIRILYECFFMGLLLVKHVAQINKKLKGDASEQSADPYQETESLHSPRYCNNCGYKMGKAAFCPQCGAPRAE